MNHLSRTHLKSLSSTPFLTLPSESVFDLPEKVLQFGTGVLLRGLPDFFIDKANRQGLFNGRVVVVKSTDSGDFASFGKQDGLYTLCVRGIEDGEAVEENIVNSSISRVLFAKTDWQAILAFAKSPELRVVLSNTTEVGIQLVPGEDIRQSPPESFPGKLLACLYARFQALGANPAAGLVIVPTELIPGNGTKLKQIVGELARQNKLEEDFLDWLETHNHFCNSLVDRIVPGAPDKETQARLQEEFGYQDELLSISEVYRLWAIEGNEHVKSVLSFHQADEGVVIEPNIDLYRELKLRLLNGTHTLSCGLAFLAGFTTVKEAMADAAMAGFIRNLMLADLAPGIPYEVPAGQAEAFGRKVLDRFRNPSIEHHWLSITLQYTSKIKMRNLPTLLHYYRRHNQVPEHVAFGFAAYLLFMKVAKQEGSQFFGELNGALYLIKDDQAATLQKHWQQHPEVAGLVAGVFRDQTLWGEDLTQLPGFANSVIEKLTQMQEEGVGKALKAFMSTMAAGRELR
jgi:tagaturonate reductase